jgi:hypothetical protein
MAELAIRHKELNRLERVIERGLGTFAEVGAALAEIREKKLYQEDGFGRFEDYCQQRWNFTSGRARQLMRAAETGTRVPVRNEAEARAIAPAIRELGPEQATEIIDMVREEKGEDFTAADIREAVAERVETAPATLRPTALSLLRLLVETFDRDPNDVVAMSAAIEDARAFLVAH